MRIPRLLVAIHRWLGVMLCLFMAAWFASGAVLIYVPFPSLPYSDRLARSNDINTSVLALSPADAIRTSGVSPPIDRIRLVARSERPLYVVKGRNQAELAVWADNGGAAILRANEEARDIASQFSGEAAGRIEGPIDYDQWIVHQGFDDQRPYLRVHIDDTAGTVLYVSQSTGEVLQRTTRAQRGWNYVGAVVHWIYPTALRKHWTAWDRVVWWLSLAGMTLVVIGFLLGVDHTLLALRNRQGRVSLFRGWMKWHHILGLVTFIFVLTWIFSGWLSMDHGRIFSMPDATAAQVDRFRGMTLIEACRTVSVKSMQRMGKFRELEIEAIAATPVMIVRSQNEQRIYSVNSGQPFPGAVLPTALIQSAVQTAWPEFNVTAVEGVAVDDVYRKVRQNELPLSTIRVKLDDPGETWVHVDARTGEILSVMDRSRRLYRWLYNGFHSLDFPGLIEHRPLWDITILSLLAIGFTFSLTGAVVGMRRLKRSLTNLQGNL